MARTVMALLLVLSAACGGTGAGPGDGDGPITFMVFGDPEELRAYRDLIDAFEEANPGDRVRLVEASDREDLLTRLSTSFAGGSPPDLFLMNYRFYGQFAVRGVLEPLQPRLEASDVFDADDFYEPAMDAFRWDGRQLCMPQNISSLVVYYNRDLFREAGVPEPAEGWTWDEMVDTALRLTVDEDGDGLAEQYGLGIEASIIRVAPFVWSNGGQVVDDPERPTGLALDSPEAQEALQAFFDLRGVHQVIPTEDEHESEDDEARFLNGRTAMFLSSRRSTPVLRTITDFDWDVAALPRHREQAGILHSDAYCMTTASGNQDLAWRFVEFALGPEGAPITAASGRTVPSLRSVAESEAFLDPDARPANSRVFLDTIPVIRRVPSISTWPEIEDAAEGFLEEGLFEGVPASDVARQLAAHTAPLFARAEHG